MAFAAFVMAVGLGTMSLLFIHKGHKGLAVLFCVATALAATLLAVNLLKSV